MPLFQPIRPRIATLPSINHGDFHNQFVQRYQTITVRRPVLFALVYLRRPANGPRFRTVRIPVRVIQTVVRHQTVRERHTTLVERRFGHAQPSTTTYVRVDSRQASSTVAASHPPAPKPPTEFTPVSSASLGIHQALLPQVTSVSPSWWRAPTERRPMPDRVSTVLLAPESVSQAARSPFLAGPLPLSRTADAFAPLAAPSVETSRGWSVATTWLATRHRRDTIREIGFFEPQRIGAREVFRPGSQTITAWPGSWVNTMLSWSTFPRPSFNEWNFTSVQQVHPTGFRGESVERVPQDHAASLHWVQRVSTLASVRQILTPLWPTMVATSLPAAVIEPWLSGDESRSSEQTRRFDVNQRFVTSISSPETGPARAWTVSPQPSGVVWPMLAYADQRIGQLPLANPPVTRGMESGQDPLSVPFSRSWREIPLLFAYQSALNGSMTRVSGWASTRLADIIRGMVSPTNPVELNNRSATTTTAADITSQSPGVMAERQSVLSTPTLPPVASPLWPHVETTRWLREGAGRMGLANLPVPTTMSVTSRVFSGWRTRGLDGRIPAVHANQTTVGPLFLSLTGNDRPLPAVPAKQAMFRLVLPPRTDVDRVLPSALEVIRVTERGGLIVRRSDSTDPAEPTRRREQVPQRLLGPWATDRAGAQTAPRFDLVRSERMAWMPTAVAQWPGLPPNSVNPPGLSFRLAYSRRWPGLSHFNVTETQPSQFYPIGWSFAPLPVAGIVDVRRAGLRAGTLSQRTGNSLLLMMRMVTAMQTLATSPLWPVQSERDHPTTASPASWNTLTSASFPTPPTVTWRHMASISENSFAGRWGPDTVGTAPSTPGVSWRSPLGTQRGGIIVRERTLTMSNLRSSVTAGPIIQTSNSRPVTMVGPRPTSLSPESLTTASVTGSPRQVDQQATRRQETPVQRSVASLYFRTPVPGDIESDDRTIPPAERAQESVASPRFTVTRQATSSGRTSLWLRRQWSSGTDGPAAASNGAMTVSGRRASLAERNLNLPATPSAPRLTMARLPNVRSEAARTALRAMVRQMVRRQSSPNLTDFQTVTGMLVTNRLVPENQRELTTTLRRSRHLAEEILFQSRIKGRYVDSPSTGSVDTPSPSSGSDETRLAFRRRERDRNERQKVQPFRRRRLKQQRTTPPAVPSTTQRAPNAEIGAAVLQSRQASALSAADMRQLADRLYDAVMERIRLDQQRRGWK